MQFVYNTPSGFDAWEKLGNAGWNWKNMVPYLQKFHTHHKADPTDIITEIRKIAMQDEAVESQEGPIQTSYSQTTDVDKAWYESWKTTMDNLGYDCGDVGGFTVPSSIDPKTKTRSFAATAYYNAEISARPNLRVITESMVEKISLNTEPELTACGVELVSKAGKRHVIRAEREVILCAGTVGSPQILELSGIGCEKLLKSRGVNPILDLPAVGENLQEHALSMNSFEVAEGIQTACDLGRNPELIKPLLAMYEKDRSGPLGSYFSACAHFRLPETFRPSGSDYLPSLFNQVSPTAHKEQEKLKDEVTLDLLGRASVQILLAKVQFNIAGKSKITEMFKPTTPGNFFTIALALHHPFSRGSIHIASTDPNVSPLIDPKYLSHPMDLELLARHVQHLSTFVSTPPFSTFLKPNGRRIPEYKNDGGDQDLDAVKEMLRETLMTIYHPVGTCSMGKKESGGVVDERLRVHGIKGLRVCDASVMPILPRGNITTTVYAVAERCADLIKEYWSGKE